MDPAPPLSLELPKMPRRMIEVYRQIECHPRKSELDESTRFAYEGARDGFSIHRDNNRWVRNIWKKLHWRWETSLDE